MKDHWDVIIIGAGAAGLMCAIEAGKRGRSVLVLDNGKKIGRKIIISGGGRCNFTNMYAEPENFLSTNPHYCKSALSQYTQWDFIALVDKYQIPYHEKTLGQLFCDDSAKDIVDMLVSECNKVKAKIQLRTQVSDINKTDDGFTIDTDQGDYHCHSLVVASGGLSMPALGATPYGYKIAEKFGLNVLPTRAGLVPFTLQPKDKEDVAELSGVALPSIASNQRTSFKEAMLFTHRGLSGPSVLQISSYWLPGEEVSFNLYPEGDIAEFFNGQLDKHGEQILQTVLSKIFPKRVAAMLISRHCWDNIAIKQLPHKVRDNITNTISNWQITPSGSEGYRTAEVTLGGVDTNELSSKTMQARNVDGLYFIGEVVDVTGWLGGYNFQWAWSSGWVAGQNC